METLIDILELSVEKNGEMPLTNLHLLRIVKMAKRRKEHQEWGFMVGSSDDGTIF